MIQSLLAAGADRDSLDAEGQANLAAELSKMEAAGHRRPVDASLFAAAQSGDQTKARMALALGAAPDSTTPSGNAPIHAAIHTGSLPMVKLLAQAGANLDMKDARQLAPLHLVATNGFHSSLSATLVAALIEFGADVNAKDPDGFTPLHFAANNRSKEVIKALLAGGADANVADSAGMTPLASLVSRQWADRESAALLLPKTDLLRLDKKGRSVAEIAYEGGNPEVGAMIEQHAASQERALLSSPGALADPEQTTRSRLRM